MPDYVIDGITLSIPQERLTAALADALTSGRYENTEATAIKAHLRPDDRFLDLGCGAGYLLAQAARLVNSGHLAGVEASPGMAGVARAALARTGAVADIRWGAVVPDDHAGEHAEFLERRAFWASALAAKDTPAGAARHITVPALRFSRILTEIRPTALCIDIEGGEAALFDCPLPAHVRLVVIEIHPGVYGPGGIKRVFDGLSASGFAYVPQGSRGATLVFARL